MCRNFARRLAEALDDGPRIVAAHFSGTPQRSTVIVRYEDGVVERLWTFNPSLASFAEQELIGLTKAEAGKLKALKTDEAIGLHDEGT